MAEPTNISDARFDGAAVWATLTPEVQAEIGAYALEAAAARGIIDYAEGPAARAATQAEVTALFMLRIVALGERGFHDRGWVVEVEGRERFRIPSILGLVCQACGYTEDDAHEEGCSWASETICAACAH